MKWTNEKPTKEGWYWYRPQITKGCRAGQYRFAYIVYVDSEGTFETVGEIFKHVKDTLCQWSDSPIPQPED